MGTVVRFFALLDNCFIHDLDPNAGRAIILLSKRKHSTYFWIIKQKLMRNDLCVWVAAALIEQTR